MASVLVQGQAAVLRHRPAGLTQGRSQTRSLSTRRPVFAKVYSMAASAESITVQTKKAGGEQQTLFSKLGGAPAVTAAVDLFYQKMLADPRVAYFFEGIDMNKQRIHQAQFLSFAMGGSQRYEGNANMTTAHARLARELDMRMEHFDIVLEHLAAALVDLNVPQDDISEAAAVVETLRPAFKKAIDNAHK